MRSASLRASLRQSGRILIRSYRGAKAPLFHRKCLRGHDPNGCDVIVCWVHNWPECPLNIDVVELCKLAREGWKPDFSPQISAESADKKLGRE